MKQKLFFLILFLTVVISAYSQEVVNRVWEQTTGLPDDNIAYQTATFDNQENLIVVGNTYTAGEAENFLITKYDANGGSIWQQEYNHAPNQTDFATAVATDAQNNIYVVGATDDTQTNGLDYVVLKLDINGNIIWTATYNGFGQDDVAIACAVDNNGNVYVTGSSENGVNNQDFATIKYNSSGTQQWVKRYDYTGLTDVAVSVRLTGNGHILVTGGSASAISRWDYATLEYNTSGTVLNTKRHSLGIAGFDQPTDMVQDASGNVYITGSASSDGINYDIQTIKLDNNLGLVWAVQWDGQGLEDKALDLEIDNSGNLYLTGYTTTADATTDILTLKYDNNGNELWANQRSMEAASEYVTQLEINTIGQIYVTGTAERNGQTDYLTLRYAPDGEIEWERYFDGGQTEEATQIKINVNDEIYITGKSKNGTTTQYKTLKYERIERSQTYNYSGGTPTSIKNEVIVRFTTPIINTAIIDNREIHFATVGQVINDPTAIALMDAELNAGGDFQNWILIKIFPEMTSAPLTNTTRQGKQIPIPSFWTTFVLQTPEQVAESNNETLIAEKLSATILKPYVQYAHPNYLGKLNCIPNDFNYINQLSLSSSSGFANIDAENAWCKAVGQPYIKVGIYDSGIDYNHPDFDALGINKIKDGKHYGLNVPTSTLSNPDDNSNGGHGTPVAGILGALRNNTTGIAGIAGGDMTFGVDNMGVSLYDFKIFADTNSVGIDKISQAIIDGGKTINNNGYEIHLSNHSWGIPAHLLVNFVDSFNILKDAYYFAYRSGVVGVAARGNTNNGMIGLAQKVYPAGFDDDWVISVGGSAPDGAPSIGTFWGDNVDFIAPDDISSVYSLMNTLPGYGYFQGTSFSAPHATGTAALLLSYWNDTTANTTNKLYQEDVEHILELGAADVTLGSLPVGYDPQSGWGLLQASAALDSIWKNDGFHLIHIPEDGGTKTLSTPTLVGGLMDTIIVSDTINGLLPNTYLGGKYEVTATYNHSNTLNSSHIRNFWLRNSVAEGYDGQGNTPKYYSCEVVSTSNNQFEAKSYTYQVTHDINGVPLPTPVWLLNTTDIECPYTIRVAGYTTSTYQQISDKSAILGMVFPNPTTDELHIPITLEKGNTIECTLYDINGRAIQSIFSGQKEQGKHLFSLSTQNLPQGVYLIGLKTDYTIQQQKFIKIN